LVTEREIHSETLPPQFTPGLRLRMLALRVDAGDLSPQPFQEVWLFSYGLLEKERVWYALSHIVTSGGDVTFGRETFGYPSRLGEVEVVATPTNFSVLGRRHGRDLVYAEGWQQGFSTGTSLLQMRVAGLRAGPFGSTQPVGGELIVQPWHFQGQLSQVLPESIGFEFPEPQSRNGVTDPWFEFNPVRVAAVSVMHYGSMQREPGQTVAQWPDFQPFYRERCDGILPGEAPDAFQAPTFRARPGAQLQSGLLPRRRSL
jgi:hypothetical protein